MIAHPFGVAGLLVDAVASIGLLKFTADLDAGSSISHEPQSPRSASSELRRPYLRHIRAYRFAFFALTVGFLLQLIDLLIA